MNNPQGKLTHAALVFQRTAAAEGHSRRHLLGISAHEVERAVAAEAHAQHVDAVVVVGIVVLIQPFQNVVQFLGIPRAARVLRRDDQRRHLPSHLDGGYRSVAQGSVEVVAAEAGTVKEEHQGCRLLRVVVVLGGVDPEVVASGYDVSLC